MQKKVFKHKEIEECGITKKEIDTTKEKYVVIMDCNGKKIEKVKFYKFDILNDLIKNGGEKVRKELMTSTMRMAGGMLERFGILKPPTYAIE